jgi:predicted nucleotidyltransferase
LDIGEIRNLALHVRRELLKKNIKTNVAILFGSYAKGIPRKDSDIDLAFVSSSFGRDRFKEGVLLNRLAQNIDSRIEAIPIALKEYQKLNTLSPILDQINKTGIVLF